MYTTINRVYIGLPTAIRKAKPGYVALKGWVFNIRSSGSILFLQFRDGTGELQAVINKKAVDSKTWETATKLTIESSCEISGRLYREKRAPSGLEVAVKKFKLIHLGGKYPIGKKEHGPDFLLSHRHLWLRDPKQAAILKIRAGVEKAIHGFFEDKGFIRTDTPILTSSAPESTTDLFKTKYFGKGKAFLAQTGQLYLEATSAALNRTYNFGPTFRAEKSKTRRHLTEFWMVEAEASFVNFEENMKIQEELVLYIIRAVLKNHQKELAVLGRDLKLLQKIKKPFLRMTYAKTIRKLQDLGAKIKPGDDLGADEEALLMTHLTQPLFVTHWPIKMKPFYVQPDAKDPNLVLNSDLLAPEGWGEIVGASERVNDLKVLENKLKLFKLPRKSYEWYLDLRRFGSVPHSGFGLGLERLIGWICGLDHIREAIPFPRTIYRIEP